MNNREILQGIANKNPNVLKKSTKEKLLYDNLADLYFNLFNQHYLYLQSLKNITNPKKLNNLVFEMMKAKNNTSDKIISRIYNILEFCENKNIPIILNGQQEKIILDYKKTI